MKLRLFIFLFGFSVFLPELQAQSADNINDVSESKPDGAVQQPDSIRQVDMVGYLIKLFKINASEEKRDQKRVRFSLFPTESGMAGGKTVVTTVNAAFLLGDIANTNVSTLYFIPYIAFDGRFGFQIQSNIWLNKNSWNFTGEYFILNYPQNTWGLGGNSPDENETLIDYKQVRFHQNALKGVLPHLAVGLGYAYDRHYAIDAEDPNIEEENYPSLPRNTVSSGLTFPMVFDSRRNSINPQQGFFSSLTYSLYLPALGSDDQWQSFFGDTRTYLPISSGKPKILAFRSYYWTIISGKVPYLDLPANRWEPITGSSSRGIQQNRYRSNAMLYFESEYRFGITENGFLGGVVFSNVTAPSEYDTQQFKYWHPAAGAGVRIKFNKYSNTNIAFDFGFSKGWQSVYLNIGEAF